MLTIKLSRTGKKKHALYRLIILEKARDPWGKNLENLGVYDPHTKKAELKAERIKYWIEKGAQTTPTVNNLLISQGIMAGEKVKASASKLGKKKKTAFELKKAEDAKAEAEKAKAAEAPKE